MLCPVELPPLSGRPLVSVVLTCYNYLRWVGAAVESVLAQTYQPIELVICDDGSTDGSAELLRKIAARHPDSIRFFRQENAGQAAAINAACRRAAGEIVILLDADDLFDPDKVAGVVSEFERQPNRGLAVHPLRPIDGAGRALGPPVPRRLDSGWIGERALTSGGKTDLPPTSGLSFRRAVLAEILPAPLALRVCADGYLREAAQMITPVAAIDRTLGSYRLHGANLRGGGQLTAARLRHLVEVELPAIHEAVAEFLERRFGAATRDQFRLEDAPGYWEKLLLLEILEPEVRDIGPGSRDAVLARLQAGERALLLRLLARLPGIVARPAAQVLFGDVAWRRRLTSSVRRLQRMGRWQRTPHEAY